MWQLLPSAEYRRLAHSAWLDPGHFGLIFGSQKPTEIELGINRLESFEQNAEVLCGCGHRPEAD